MTSTSYVIDCYRYEVFLVGIDAVYYGFCAIPPSLRNRRDTP